MITTLTQAMNVARKNLTLNEQKMLIDIYNGTLLTPHLLGRTMLAEVEDSFNLYPGVYEEKWGVNKDEMLEKIKNLDTLSAALIELWAVNFWETNDDNSISLEDYLSGKITLASRFQQALKQLEQATSLMEKSKSAFKSKTIAEARSEVEKALKILKDLE